MKMLERILLRRWGRSKYQEEGWETFVVLGVNLNLHRNIYFVYLSDLKLRTRYRRENEPRLEA